MGENSEKERLIEETTDEVNEVDVCHSTESSILRELPCITCQKFIRFRFDLPGSYSTLAFSDSLSNMYRLLVVRDGVTTTEDVQSAMNSAQCYGQCVACQGHNETHILLDPVRDTRLIAKHPCRCSLERNPIRSPSPERERRGVVREVDKDASRDTSRREKIKLPCLACEEFVQIEYDPAGIYSYVGYSTSMSVIYRLRMIPHEETEVETVRGLNTVNCFKPCISCQTDKSFHVLYYPSMKKRFIAEQICRCSWKYMPQGPVSSAVTGLGQRAIVTVPLTKAPAYIQCPYCHVLIKTKVELDSTCMTEVAAVCLCLIFCPCVCLPICAEWFYVAKHTCPNCWKLVGKVDV